MSEIKAYGYYLAEVNQPLQRRDFKIGAIDDNSVVVEIAGCGLCHTDITFLTGQVKTKKEYPLILGHEISGKVVAVGRNYSALMGKSVIIPAVLPCGECDLCKAGRDNICQQQKMPGNDFDGGFASHIVVPARFLCALPPQLGKHKLSTLSVIADAVTTPYQSMVRSELKKNDLAIVIGVGGIGIYMVQHAKNIGASVIAIDIDDKKLENAKKNGADHCLSAKSIEEADVKKEIRALVKGNKLPQHQWKVFETSGTAPGQRIAYNLLSFAGTVAIVGFTMDKAPLRLSNLMAFDATLFGNWGCRPTYYKNVVDDVIAGKLNISDNVQEYPLDSINEIIQLSVGHKLDKRAIFVP